MLRKILAASLFATVVILALGSCSKNDCPTCAKKPAVLYLNEHKVDFGDTDTTASFAIANKGEAALAWTVTVSPSSAAAKLAGTDAGGWLWLSQTSGSDDATITCRAIRSHLTSIGTGRATIIINSPDAANTVRDSIEVVIRSGGKWLTSDDGVYDSCATVDADDWYWVKEFRIPEGIDAVVVDSISFAFCTGGEDIELLAFDWTSQAGVKYPGDYLFVSPPPNLTTEAGVNMLHVNWLIQTSPFYIGYFQLGSESPRPQFDTPIVGSDPTFSWTARDLDPDPDSVSLSWILRDSTSNPATTAPSQTLAFRVFIRPIVDYSAKLAVNRDDVEANLRQAFAIKGHSPKCLKPQLAR